MSLSRFTLTNGEVTHTGAKARVAYAPKPPTTKEGINKKLAHRFAVCKDK